MKLPVLISKKITPAKYVLSKPYLAGVISLRKQPPQLVLINPIQVFFNSYDRLISPMLPILPHIFFFRYMHNLNAAIYRGGENNVPFCLMFICCANDKKVQDFFGEMAKSLGRSNRMIASVCLQDSCILPRNILESILTDEKHEHNETENHHTDCF